jgi:SAM-dependent methyltransferase
MADKPPPSAAYYDDWYASMVGSPARDEIARRHLDLPPDLLSTSLLSGEGLTEVVAALRLTPGATLLDLACGRGGYGIEVARRTGADLIGVDFSAEAVRQATGNAAEQGFPARFRVGTFDATGLADASVDAIMCVDAVQFAVPASAAFAEARRVLRPGGRIVLTCWEPVDRDDERFPDRFRLLDLRAGLTAAGFVEVTVDDRPAWLERELAMWREAAALDPGDDGALRSMHDEGIRVLESPLMRRVIATATGPAP